jgi:hypothetical protein
VLKQIESHVTLVRTVSTGQASPSPPPNGKNVGPSTSLASRPGAFESFFSAEFCCSLDFDRDRRASSSSSFHLACLLVSPFQIRLWGFVVPFLFDKHKSFAVVVAVHCCQRESYSVRGQEDVHENIESSISRIVLHATLLVALSCRFDILLSSCMLAAYFGVNPHRSFQIVSSVPRGTTTRPLKSSARKNPLSLPSPFCIRFVSVFFHPKQHVCKQDL